MTKYASIINHRRYVHENSLMVLCRIKITCEVDIWSLHIKMYPTEPGVFYSVGFLIHYTLIQLKQISGLTAKLSFPLEDNELRIAK